MPDAGVGVAERAVVGAGDAVATLLVDVVGSVVAVVAVVTLVAVAVGGIAAVVVLDA